jgi:hypothetical protein
MSKRYRDPNSIPSNNRPKCQHPLVIGYTPPKSAEVEIEIDETTSDVRTCNSTARYILNGVHYCDRHYQQVTTTNSSEYSEYDDPADLGHDFGD